MKLGRRSTRSVGRSCCGRATRLLLRTLRGQTLSPGMGTTSFLGLRGRSSTLSGSRRRSLRFGRAMPRRPARGSSGRPAMVDNGVSLDALEAQYNGPAPTGGNSIWAARYGEFVRQVVAEHSRRAERSQQVHLGPSELGVECDRQVVAKLTRVPSVNSMGDSWPSVRGTALHSW